MQNNEQYSRDLEAPIIQPGDWDTHLAHKLIKQKAFAHEEEVTACLPALRRNTAILEHSLYTKPHTGG